MITANIVIINKLGLHARAAAKLVNTASMFSSDITIIKDEKSVDAKSIMSVMMLAASKGTELTFCYSGNDETAAQEAIEALINDYFGEGE